MLKLSKQKIIAIKIWFIRQIYNYFMWLSKLWYTLTMRLTKVNDSRVSLYTNHADIAKSFDWGKLYKYDPLNGKLDYLAHPSKLAKNLKDGQLFGDCDDHAIYWCTSLLKSGLAESAWFCFYTMVKKNSLEMSSHAICVFKRKEDGWFYWADYNLPSCLMEGRHKWAQASAEKYGADAVAAVMIEIKEIKEDDTPVFGKIEVVDIP